MSSRRLSLFKTKVPEGFEWALPVDHEEQRALWDIDLLIERNEWTPLKMELLTTDERGRPVRHANMPWCDSGVLVLRDDAIDRVGPILSPFGTLQELLCDDARLMLFRPRSYEGLLDQELSDIVFYPSGRVMDVRRPVFRDSDVVADRKVFLVPEQSTGPIYVTEDVVRSIVSTGCSAGTEFVATEDD